MSKKAQETPNTETALISVDSILNGEAVTAKEAVGDGLPYLKMHHAVEVELNNPYHLHAYIGGEPHCLEAPYRIVTIASKHMVRANVEIDGKTRYLKAYDLGKPDGFYQQCQNDPSLSLTTGRVYIVALQNNQGQWALCEFETCKTADNYWKFLPQASIGEKRIVEIELSDHKPNLTKSKGGSYYLSPKQFIQYKIFPLSPEELETVKDLVKANSATITDWMQIEKRDPRDQD